MSSAPFEFDPEQGSRFSLRLFGGFVLLAALVPTAIVAAQWLTFDGRGPAPQTGEGSIIPGALVALWGLHMLTAKARLRADPVARTLTWSKRTLGLWHGSRTWPWSDVQAFVARQNDHTDRRQGYTSVALGTRGERVVCGYSRHATASEVVRLSVMLSVPYNIEH